MSTAVFSSRNTANIFETFYIGIYFKFPGQCCIFFLCLNLNEFIAYLLYGDYTSQFSLHITGKIIVSYT